LHALKFCWDIVYRSSFFIDGILMLFFLFEQTVIYFLQSGMIFGFGATSV
jgi:hypothetical protein